MLSPAYIYSLPAFEKFSNLIESDSEFYVRANPPVKDPLNYKGTLVVESSDNKITIQVDNEQDVRICLMCLELFSIWDRTVYFWDIKNFITWIRHSLKDQITYTDKFYDLRVLSSYTDANFNPASTIPVIREFVSKLSEKVKDVHKNVHLPLIFEVLPKVESRPISGFYTIYEVEGQKNGRLRCYCPTDRYVPIHSLSHNDRACLRPACDEVLELDFKAMEACVLCYFSKDKILSKIINSGRDIYDTIFRLASPNVGEGVDTRKLIKDTLLPTFYGASVSAIVSNTGIDTSLAESLQSSYHKFFSTSFDWLKGQQKKAESGYLVDEFDRRRCLLEGSHVAKNSSIQSPASLVCLEKFVNLSRSFDVLANVHDAYYIRVRKQELRETAINAVELLQSPSRFFPGLKLKVGIKIGQNLGQFQNYEL